MMHRLVAAGILLAVALPAWTASSPRAPVVLVFGDSVSAGYGLRVEEGWVALLQGRLQAQGYGYRVVNASVSGETTAGGLTRLPRALKVHRPEIVVLELGGNDGLRGLPLGEVRRSLDGMIRAARASGARVLLVGMRLPPNYGGAYVDGFHAIFGDLAKRYDLPLVPFLLEGVALDAALMQADGIHPTAAAQPRLLDNVWPVLKPLLRAPKSAHAGARAAGARVAGRQTPML
jgi:acyl-CoA thioesterase-1